MEIGKHGYSGSCAPIGSEYFGNNTFSVGIFEWLPKVGGKGLKKSAVKVRVKGPFSRAEYVYRKAKQVCSELDEGTYSGPKNIQV